MQLTSALSSNPAVCYSIKSSLDIGNCVAIRASVYLVTAGFMFSLCFSTFFFSTFLRNRTADHDKNL